VTTPLIVHQLVARGALAGLGNDTVASKKKTRAPVLPAEARRAIQMIRERPELAERFIFLCEMGDRKPGSVKSACDAAKHLMPLLVGHDVEHVGVIFLDTSLRVIAAEVLSKGGAAYSVVDAPVILRRALVLRATSIIIGHNHPSGALEPSTADIQVTRSVQRAGEAVGIRLIDHIIIAGTQYVSLAESGRM